MTGNICHSTDFYFCFIYDSLIKECTFSLDREAIKIGFKIGTS